MSADIVVIGSLNMDLVVRTPRAPRPGETVSGTDFRKVPGGKGANQAVAVARLGGSVAMSGRVGADGFGRLLLDSLAQTAVDARHVTIDPDALTGVALITVEDAGQNRIVVYPGANARVNRQDVDALEGTLRQASWLVLQLEIPLDTVAYAAHRASRQGLGVVLNPAPALPLPAELLQQVSILVPNESEAAMLSGVDVVDVSTAEQAGQVLRAMGPQAVIVTLGARGALLVSEAGSTLVPAPPVQVVDTTAAGDAFVGGLVTALVRGLSLPEAVRYGVYAGSLAASKLGAQPSLPLRHEVEALVERAGTQNSTQ